MATLRGRALAPLLLLALFFAFVLADDCEICDKSKPTDCDRSGVATLHGSPKYIQNKGVTTCAQAYQYVTCGECKNGRGRKGGDCCSLACKEDGRGNVKAHCLCGPPRDNPGEDHTGQITQTGVCADPHFQGAFGIQYDFHGIPDRDFNLITDQGLNVNAHFIGQTQAESGFDGTWMSALGFTWADGFTVRTAVVAVKEGPAAFNEAVPFTFEIDGQELHPESFVAAIKGQDSILYEDEGLAISVAPFAYAYRVSIGDHIEVIVTAGMHDHPVGNHIDIGINKLNVTATVHGALGQTFAASRAAALKAAASEAGDFLKFNEGDVIEGKDVDYMTSSLLGTDFVYNRFGPTAPGVFSKMNVVARQMLGFEEDLPKEAVEGQLSCFNRATGGLSCFS